MNIPVRKRAGGLILAALCAAAVGCATGCVRETSARDFLAHEDVQLTPVTGDLAEVDGED